VLSEINIGEILTKYPKIHQTYDTFFASIIDTINELVIVMKKPEGNQEKIQRYWDELQHISLKKLF